MKKIIVLLFIAGILVMVLLAMGCTPQGDSSGGGDNGGSSGSSSSDPFVGILYRDMLSITGGTYTQTDGTHSFNHTISRFNMGKYEVTYELWYTVYQWAITNGYVFVNAGREGNDGTDGASPTGAKYEPVTVISWRDSLVWCNAYSEMSGLTPCYTNSGTVIKDSTYATACDKAVLIIANNGYRFPTEGEWQYAASNKGATPYNYASGDSAPYNTSTTIGNYAWYISNSGGTTHDAGTKTANALTLYDMSGNVWEWCWDWVENYPGTAQNDYTGPGSGYFRIVRGGGWDLIEDYLLVGIRNGYDSSVRVNFIGFRVARTN